MNQQTLRKQTFAISGMTCEACEYKIKHVLGKIEGVENVETDLASGQTTIEAARKLSFEEIETVLKPHSKYKVVSRQSIVDSQQSANPASNVQSLLSQYYPLILIFLYITIISFLTAVESPLRDWLLKSPLRGGPTFRLGGLAWGAFLHNFMTGFFLVFSFFKLLNVKAFAESFAMYDLAAMRFPTYGKIYPFIELALGLLCLVHYQPKMVYWADIILMSFGNLGVISSVLDKRKIQCACLGTVFNLPMSTVTIIENTVMVVVGIVLLIIL